MDLSSALQKLATYRVQNTRASQETFEKGVIILKNNAARKMGDEGELRLNGFSHSQDLTVDLQVGLFWSSWHWRQ
jgi:hypothetical protein